MAQRTYTDPPGMPEDERMTAAEFQSVREFLGLSQDWLARHLSVTLRTVQHWEAGKYKVPDGVRLEMEDLEARTGEFVGGIVGKLMDMPDPVVVVYRTDAEYKAANPDTEFPARWLRMVVMRVALEVPALSIVYADQAAQESAHAAHR